MKLSICIPTYNRAHSLENCLNSIITSRLNSNFSIEVCVSDNHSTDNTEEVVNAVKSRLKIKYHRNYMNLGIPRNFIQVVSMASNDFVWLIGDDDLLMPYAIEKIHNLIISHPNVDFFYVNSFHLESSFLKKYQHPFDTKNLPSNMSLFSNYTHEGELPFIELINPKISFDFLGGMFLSVFRRGNWVNNVSTLNKKAIFDPRTFSHFDNTFPHIKIFSKAFSTSVAYFNAPPLSVCLSGLREWAPMNSLIMSVRLIEALSEYRKNGLSYWRYICCKNFALRNFFSDFIYINLYKERSGYSYIKPYKLLLDYIFYPNFYFSIFSFCKRRVKAVFNYIFKRFI